VLGRGGDRVIMDMLLECAIFRPVSGGTANYYQLSGSPISDVKPDQKRKNTLSELAEAAKTAPVNVSCENRSPSTITFVRSRMLYAKAALNAKGGVQFGMRHIRQSFPLLVSCAGSDVLTDVLNRFPNRDEQHQTIHILRYIFPRQFGLHNVFTSKVDPRETAMPFKDYTLRDKEIHQSMCRALEEKASDEREVSKWKSHTPRRLRGATVALIDRLRTLNHRCSYVELLRHYCPVKVDPTIACAHYPN
jgi:telomerase reverse transcriptase